MSSYPALVGFALTGDPGRGDRVSLSVVMRREGVVMPGVCERDPVGLGRGSDEKLRFRGRVEVVECGELGTFTLTES
jgi:hypothetical protein